MLGKMHKVKWICYPGSMVLGFLNSASPFLFQLLQRFHTGGLQTTEDPLNVLRISSKHSKFGRQCKNPDLWLFLWGRKSAYLAILSLRFHMIIGNES